MHYQNGETNTLIFAQFAVSAKSLFEAPAKLARSERVFSSFERVLEK